MTGSGIAGQTTFADVHARLTAVSDHHRKRKHRAEEIAAEEDRRRAETAPQADDGR